MKNTDKILTISCIYNSISEYAKMLSSLVKTEKIYDLCKVEFMGIYNKNNSRFSSAREAISWVMKRSKARYILFIHQDVEFISDNPISKLLEYLKITPDLGIFGVAGVDHKNKRHGFIINKNAIWGEPFFIPKEVEGIDELFFGLERERFNDFSFLNIHEWHGYATELCMYSKRKGWNNYVIPITVIHKSFGKNRKRLLKVHKKLEEAYRDVLPFMTTVGILGVKKRWLLLLPKLAIKNFLNKISLNFSFAYVKTKFLFLSVVFTVFPITKKLRFFADQEIYVLNFLVNKNNKVIFFVHVRDSIDGQTNFDDIRIESRSLSNVMSIPNKGKVIHLYVSSNKFKSNKFKNVMNSQDFKECDQMIIENYKLVSDFKNILSSFLIPSEPKITVISKFVSIYKAKVRNST